MADLIDRQKLLALIEREREWLEELDTHNVEKILCHNILHIIKSAPNEGNITQGEYDKVVNELEETKRMLCDCEEAEALATETEQLASEYMEKADL